MERLESLRRIIDEVLDETGDSEDRRSGFVHLHGVSAAAALLALRRGLGAELAAGAGMLRDRSPYETGTPDNHATRGARRASEILRSQKAFTDLEIEAVRSAIAHHSDKAAVHDAFSELLKDADVLQHFLSNPEAPSLESHASRRLALKREMGL